MGRPSGTVLGSITFVVAATGAFLELQAALNTIWRVKPNRSANLTAFVAGCVRSFGLVVLFAAFVSAIDPQQPP